MKTPALMSLFFVVAMLSGCSQETGDHGPGETMVPDWKLDMGILLGEGNDPTGFESFVALGESLAGPDAVDCGTSRLDPVTHEPRFSGVVGNCMASSFGEGRAFHGRLELQGTDSRIYEQIVSTEGGQVLFLYFDSDPCGGNACEHAITTMRCVGPSVGESEQGGPIACDRTEMTFLAR